MAHIKPEGGALPARILLDIPKGSMHGFKSYLMDPMRRLVHSSEETPANNAIQMVSTWQNTADVHKQCRMYVLRYPAQGSSAGLIGGAVDEGSVR